MTASAGQEPRPLQASAAGILHRSDATTRCTGPLTRRWPRPRQSPRGVYELRPAELKQTLMDDDCYLPGNVRAVPRATVQTTKGAFEAVLYEDDAPNTVANFIEIAERGFCDGLNFHRVLPGLVIQSGDPEGTGSGGPGYTIEDEVNGRKHVAGAVGMAKTARPNSAGSQFSICIDEAPHLNAGYTVFGAVTKGMDVVRAISKDDAIVRICVADRRDHGYRAWKRFPPGSDGPSAEGQPPR